MRYCSVNGLTKDDGKKIIVLDYYNTGESLKAIQSILNERKDIASSKIATHSIIDDLKKCTQDENYIHLSSKDVSAIEADMRYSKIERIANVPHFYMDETDVSKNRSATIFAKQKTQRQIFREFENFSRPLGRMYALCTLDEIKKIKGVKICFIYGYQ